MYNIQIFVIQENNSQIDKLKQSIHTIPDTYLTPVNINPEISSLDGSAFNIATPYNPFYSEIIWDYCIYHSKSKFIICSCCIEYIYSIFNEIPQIVSSIKNKAICGFFQNNTISPNLFIINKHIWQKNNLYWSHHILKYYYNKDISDITPGKYLNAEIKNSDLFVPLPKPNLPTTKTQNRPTNNNIISCYNKHKKWLESKNIKILQDPFESCEFLKMCQSQKPKNIVEIGSYCGGMLYLLSKLSTNGIIISIDITSKNQEDNQLLCKQEIRKQIQKEKHKVVLIENDSRHSMNLLAKELNGKMIDLLFIDGADDLVETDYYNYKPFVKKGGIIAIHDADSVRAPMIKNFIKQLGTEKFITFSSTGILGLSMCMNYPSAKDN